jgi:hypothetical protein
MTRMLETLEPRQMFSVATAEATALVADTSAYVDTSVPAEEVTAQRTGESSPRLSRHQANIEFGDVTVG